MKIILKMPQQKIWIFIYVYTSFYFFFFLKKKSSKKFFFLVKIFFFTKLKTKTKC